MMIKNKEQKILLYARINSNDPVNIGVIKKYRGMLNGFRTLGFQADLVWLGEKGLLFNEEVYHAFRLNDSMESCRNIFFNFILFDWHVAQKINFTDYDIFWVRFPLCHPAFIMLLREAKLQNPLLKIWLEVPTFPYNLEHRSTLRNLQFRIDHYLQQKLKKYVDRVIHYGNFSELFGIPAVGIRNGVNVAEFPVSSAIPKKGLIRLLAVGNWNYWHGLDRLIRGLEIYYQKGPVNTEINLTIIGGGRKIEVYKRLVIEGNLINIVKFERALEGYELNQHFDKTDIAIGCLGSFRKEVVLDSSLKNRHYCSRGIPFILSTTDMDFPANLPWILYVEENESPVSIQNLIDFYNRNNLNPDLKKQMRKYAAENLDWSIKLESIPFY